METPKTSNQPGKSSRQSGSSSVKKRVGTVYGSSLLRQVTQGTAQSSFQINQQIGQSPGQRIQSPRQSIQSPGQSVLPSGQSNLSPGQRIQIPGQLIHSSGQRTQSLGQSIKFPSQSIQSPSQSIQSPSQSIQSPSQSIRSPSQNIQSPSQSIRLPSQSIQSPSQNIRLPSRSIQSSGLSIQQESQLQKTGKSTALTNLQNGQHKGQVIIHGESSKEQTQPSGQLVGPGSQTPVKLQQSRRQATSQLLGQNVQPSNQSPASSAPQLCLTFVKATQPDGKPGLKAVLQKADPGQQVSPPQSQTQFVQQQQKTLSPSSSAESGHRAHVVPSGMPSKQVSPNAQSQLVKRKPVPAPSDETEQAVNALLASTSDATENEPQEPRLGTWKPKSKSLKSKDLAAKTPYQRPAAKKAQAEDLLKALTTLLKQQKTQSQMSASQQEPLVATQHHEVSEPHQLPPDKDRLGLDQIPAPTIQKYKKKKGRRRKMPKSVQLAKLQETAEYIERLDNTRYVTETAQEREAKEWSSMMKNIDVFMFPVYRCKLCPNYYSTVKNTISVHMKKVHSWVYREEDATTVEDEGHVTKIVQDKVKNIQNIFERKLRTQSGDDDYGLGLELERQSDIVEIPFDSGGASKTATDETQAGHSSCGDDDNDDEPGGLEPMDDDNDEHGGLEPVDDDDYEPGGLEPMDDDDSDHDNNHDDVEENNIEKDGPVGKSNRLVKSSTTPMIRKYTHKMQTKHSTQVEEKDTADLNKAGSKQTRKIHIQNKSGKTSAKRGSSSSRNKTLNAGEENTVHVSDISRRERKRNESGGVSSQGLSNDNGENKNEGSETENRMNAREEDVLVRKDLSEVKPKQIGPPQPSKKSKDTRSKIERKLAKHKNLFKRGSENIRCGKRVRVFRNEQGQITSIERVQHLENSDNMPNSESAEMHDGTNNVETEGKTCEDGENEQTCHIGSANTASDSPNKDACEHVAKKSPVVMLKKLPLDRVKRLQKSAEHIDGKGPSAALKSEQENTEEAGSTSADNSLSRGGIILPPKERPTTRSISKSQKRNTDTDNATTEVCDDFEDGSTPGKNWIRVSRYEAWKKIGLDPDSKPPWPCTQPGCTYKAFQLAAIMFHCIWTHDIFGDLEQRKLARQLGERYSLFDGREKRAISRASSDEESDDTRDGTKILKSRRKKKPLKRLSDNLIGENTNFLPYHLAKECQAQEKKDKPFQCLDCKRRFTSENGLNVHMRSCRKRRKKDCNPSLTESGNTATTAGEKEVDSSANIAMLADVAEEIRKEIDVACKHCSFIAASKRSLESHVDRMHPEYIRSRYSDSENEEDDDNRETQDADVGDGKQVPTTSSSRPVRKCRKKQVTKILAEERKLDEMIPEILPHHSIFGQKITEAEESEEEDEPYKSGPLLQCQECNLTCITEKGFVKHMKKVHNQDVVLKFQCEQCDLIATRKELWYHKRTVHVETVICEVCGKAVRGENRMKMHKQYWCGTVRVRPKKSKQPQKLVMKTCQICRKVLRTASSFHYHMQGHRSDEPYQCNLCQMKFKRKAQLTSHNIKVHTECRYKCEHCEYKTHFKQTLKNHLFGKHNVGLEDLPVLKCKVEGCSFNTRISKLFNRHKKSHDPCRYKYFCDGCNQPVKTLKTLAKHQVLHRDGVTKYKCTICGHQATNSNNASLHRVTKHKPPKSSLICDLCGASFKKPANLKNHIMVHHMKINPIKCKGCEQTFRFHGQMLKHFKTEHPELAEAEEEAKMQEAAAIINAPPKVRKKVVKEKRVGVKKKKPSTGRPVGRPKVPLTPEVIEKRKELTKLRNKRKYENRKAKLKRLGLKRKKYPRRGNGQATRASNQKRQFETDSTMFEDPNEDEEEAATAAQQLEAIRQAFDACRQPQEQTSQYPAQSGPSDNVYPVQIVHVPTTSGQPTALNREYDSGGHPYPGVQVVTTSGTIDSSHFPVGASHEVVITSEPVVGDDQSTLESHPVELPTSSPKAVVQDVPANQAGAVMQAVHQREGSSSSPPPSFLEVTTVQPDGSREVVRWPFWEENETS